MEYRIVPRIQLDNRYKNEYFVIGDEDSGNLKVMHPEYGKFDPKTGVVSPPRWKVYKDLAWTVKDLEKIVKQGVVSAGSMVVPIEINKDDKVDDIVTKLSKQGYHIQIVNL